MLVLVAGLLPLGAWAWAQASGQGPETAPAAAAQAEIQTDIECSSPPAPTTIIPPAVDNRDLDSLANAAT